MHLLSLSTLCNRPVVIRVKSVSCCLMSAPKVSHPLEAARAESEQHREVDDVSGGRVRATNLQTMSDCERRASLTGEKRLTKQRRLRATAARACGLVMMDMEPSSRLRKPILCSSFHQTPWPCELGLWKTARIDLDTRENETKSSKSSSSAICCSVVSRSDHFE